MSNINGGVTRSQINFDLLLARAKGLSLLPQEKEEELKVHAETFGYAFGLRKLAKYIINTMPKWRKQAALLEDIPIRYMSAYELATNHGLKLGRHGYHVRANSALNAWEYLKNHQA